MEDNRNEELIINRRVPVGEFLKLKKVSFLLYVTLQHMSSWDGIDEHRYIPMYKIKKRKLAKQLDISRTTLDAKFNELEKYGMINYYTTKDGAEYIKLPKVGDYYVIINWKLKFYEAIMRLCDETLLRVLLFHYSYNITTNGKKPLSQRKPYTVTLDYIAESIGASKTNLQKIIDCNEVLSGLEVIRIDKETKIDTQTGAIKTINIYTYLNK